MGKLEEQLAVAVDLGIIETVGGVQADVEMFAKG